MVHPLLVVVIAAAGAAGLAGLAALSLARLEDDAAVRARLRAVQLGVGLWPVLASAWLFEGPLAAAFAGFALTAAWVDRQTAWVPEAVFLPALILGGVLGWGGWAGAAAGVGVFAIGHLIWRGQVALGRPMVPPPDLAALALPPLALGPGWAGVAAYGVVAGLLALLRVFPALRRALSPEAPLGAALEDTGAGVGAGGGAGAAVAFLPVIVPPVVILALAQ
jgi:hypothetical protein